MYLKIRFILKIVEYFVLAFIVGFGLVLVGLLICNNDSCKSLIPTYQEFSIIFLVFFCSFSVLNSLRIWFNFNAYDFNKDSKDRFNLGLIGISLSYILCGIFFTEINNISAREIPISGIFLFILFTLALTFGLLFVRQDLWERSTNFTRIRLSGSVALLVAILFNPIFGIAIGAFAVPYMILYPEVATKKSIN